MCEGGEDARGEEGRGVKRGKGRGWRGIGRVRKGEKWGR